MKIFARLFLGWLGLLLMAVWAIGCTSIIPTTQKNINPTFRSTDAQAPIPIDTTTATSQPFSTNTATRAPSKTQTKAPAPLLPTPTLTIPVTLEPEQASDKIRTLLEKPESCSSPCFWGIAPNTTTLGEASNIFSRLRSPLRSLRDDNTFSASPSFDKLSINVQLETQDGLVKRIYSRVGFENYKGRDFLPLRSEFSPDYLFRLYGKPSNVELSLSYPTEPGFPAGSAWYSMVLRFDKYPFAVYYFRGEVKKGKLVHVCPLTDKFTVIDALYGYDPFTYRSKGIFGAALEKVTSLNIDQFYELITQEQGSACFDINTVAYNNP